MATSKFIMLIKIKDEYSIKYFQGQSKKAIYLVPDRPYEIEAVFNYNEENSARCKQMRDGLNRITKQSKLYQL